MHSLKVILLTLFISLGFSSCDEINGYWVNDCYLDCQLVPDYSNRDGYFESQYVDYYTNDILISPGKPVRGDIREVDLANSTIEVSTPDYGENYIVRGLVIRLGDRKSDTYEVRGDIIVVNGRIIEVSDPGFRDFMRQFAYNLGRSGRAVIAVDGFVYNRFGGTVRNARIDVVVKNDLNVRIKD